VRYHVTRLAAVCAALVATSLWACADGASPPTGFEQHRGPNDPNNAGPDTSTTSNPEPEPEPEVGPVASLQLFPAEITIGIGFKGYVGANPRDAQGRYVPGKHVTWTSSNTAVATVLADTGIVSGIAEGSATLTATVDGVSATAKVTVLDVPPPENPEPVARFTLSGGVRTLRQDPDTVRAVVVPNVVVVLYKFAPSSNDTLGTPVEVARATSSSGGDFSFGELPSATYRIVAKSPDPAKYGDGVVTFPPPVSESVYFFVNLPQK
jgi:hypothetical protein